MNLEDLNFQNFQSDTNEGKMLLAAMAILSQSRFNIGKEEINGETKTPEEIFNLVKKLAKRIFEEKKETKIKLTKCMMIKTFCLESSCKQCMEKARGKNDF